MKINLKSESEKNTPYTQEITKNSDNSIEVKSDSGVITQLGPKKKNNRLLYTILIILLIALIGASLLLAKMNSWFPFNGNSGNPYLLTVNPTPTPEPTAEPTPEPVFLANPINGLMMSESDYNAISTKPFLAVMIQNNTASRPEFGLNEADIVYESLVESNITRFMAVYWSKDSDKVMSLRSARKYFVDILGDYNNPAYMHIGYSYCAPNEKCDPKVDSLVAMNAYGIRRLSDSRDNTNNELSYSRDQACERVKAREHCAYSSTARLWKIAGQKGWVNDLSKFTSWKFVDVPEQTSQKSLTDFTVHFKNYLANYRPDYSVIWRYDASANTYLRFNNDKTPYKDGNGGQITADTIIYQKVKSSPTGDYKGHQYQETIGSGTGYVMQNGKVTSITWSKPNFSTKTKYTDPVTGQEFIFHRGKIWVEIVPNHYDYVDNAPAG